MTILFRCAVGLMALAGTIAMPLSPAAAHPHVWVTNEVTILFEKGSISGVRHKWTFDDMYTAMAIQGLDINKDGVYDRQELAELAQVNIEGLKEFEYFTYLKLGSDRLKIGAPVDYYLEHSKEGLLSLHFSLPFAQPVMTDAKAFGFQVTDPGYFIAFEPAKDVPVLLGDGAPVGCKPLFVNDEAVSAEAKRLDQVFVQQLGGSTGISVARTISLACPQQ